MLVEAIRISMYVRTGAVCAPAPQEEMVMLDDEERDGDWHSGDRSNGRCWLQHEGASLLVEAAAVVLEDRAHLHTQARHP